jgi:hypothetical protein
MCTALSCWTRSRWPRPCCESAGSGSAVRPLAGVVDGDEVVHVRGCGREGPECVPVWREPLDASRQAVKNRATDRGGFTERGPLRVWHVVGYRHPVDVVVDGCCDRGSALVAQYDGRDAVGNDRCAFRLV